MKVKIQKVSGSVLYVILIATLVVLGLFYLGGATPDNLRVVADPTISEPAQTDALLYWMYVLLGVTILVTVVGAIYQFVASMIDSPKEAMKSLVGIILLAIVLIVSWSIGSGEPLVIPSYEGTENVPFWLKIVDMFLYTFYIQLGALIALMLLFGIAKKFK
jgi:hypothetical protein